METSAITKTPIRVVVCDMDDVLADFCRSALHIITQDPQNRRWYRRSPDTILRHWPQGVTDLVEVLGMAPELFWEQVDEWLFWRTLPVLPGAREFLASLQQAGFRVMLASRPTLSAECWGAKVEWVQEELDGVLPGNPAHSLVLGRQKELLARSDVLLVDDFPPNLQKFAGLGGETVMFPWHGNARRGEVGAKMHQRVLEEILGKYEPKQEG